MIETIDLEKAFDGDGRKKECVKAVNKVSLKINEKEVFGLVGTNGAGKSTLLRMIAGY
jgi:ABC-2 type transport system ATP-binding protein